MHSHAAAVSAADNAEFRAELDVAARANDIFIESVQKLLAQDLELRERVRVLEDALQMALAELDELPVWSNTGHVCNAARAALGDKK